MSWSGRNSIEWLAGVVLLAGAIAAAGGCSTRTVATPESEFPYLYYAHNYTDARQLIRPRAADRTSKDVVLNNMRLGMASLAWGELDEAERALVSAYEYLVSGGVNQRDRTIAATVLDEGVLVWTGEPYEQAMAHYYLSAVAAVRGDYENTRAAISNALFALRDFQDANDVESFEVIESQFTLGYLVLGVANMATGNTAAARGPLRRVVELQPRLQGVVDAIASSDHDTLLLIDAGRGPRKVSAGANDQLVVFVPDGTSLPEPTVTVSVDDGPPVVKGAPPAVDLWRLSQNPSWWSLESARKAKSLIGRGLSTAGTAALIGGAAAGSDKAAIAGGGALVAGLLLQGSATADTRHVAALPRCVFVVPLTLGPGMHDVGLAFDHIDKSDCTWHDLRGGEPGRPRTYYLRAHDSNYRGMPDWPEQPLYPVKASQGEPNGVPYILGGRDLSHPTNPRVVGLARAEGLVFEPGPPTLSDAAEARSEFHRHITLGGRVWWTPQPGSYGYQYVTRTRHPPYAPRSEALKSALQSSQTSEPQATQPGTID